MIFDLPTTVEFGGQTWDINTDFRDVLTVLSAFEDVELTDTEKAYVCLYNMYPDFEQIPQKHLQAAYEAVMEFIDHGGSKKPVKRTIDWTQDADLLFPAVNSVAGYEVRSVQYLHWWTFLGFFMEIKDSTYATVLSLRNKKWVRHKKLEKWEQEFWSHNKEICEIKRKETEEEKAEKTKLEAILGKRR